MKIAINCRSLNKRHGGPKRFLLNIIESLCNIDSKNTYYLVLDKDFCFPFSLPVNFTKKILDTRSRLIFEYCLLPKFSYITRFDVLLVPDPVFAPYICGNKVTVYHDIIYFEKNHKREFKFLDNLHHKFMIPISGKFSSINLCVSYFTEKRVKTLLNLNNTKVIGEGVEMKFQRITDKKVIDQVITKYNLKLPFIFYIGSLSPRKNPIRLIKAFNNVKNEIPHNLYLFGGYSWRDKEIMDLLYKMNSDNRIEKKGFIEEEDLPVIYSLADLFLYPSLYEGFGLPILEAQACGCPVVTSNVSSMPEVAGNGAILVNPYNVNEISGAISRIISNKEFREELVQTGFENYKRFSWKKCAEEILKVCDEVYNER